jgi:hypothetical protein
MNCTTEAPRARPWRVHTLATDGEVIDVWRFDLHGGESSFAQFIEVFWAGMGEAE